MRSSLAESSIFRLRISKERKKGKKKEQFNTSAVRKWKRTARMYVRFPAR